MRHRIESVDLTQKINNVAIKIDNIEDKFHLKVLVLHQCIRYS